MSKHAVMPLTDYVNICNTLREKIGTTDLIKSGDIPKKLNDVYDMGKLATLKDSRYMNGKESGAIVSVNDVTPIEHNVGVKLSSDTITDFTGVEVARYGGNLIDCNSIVSHNNDVSADFVAGDNSFTMRGNEGTENLSYNTGMLMFPYGNIPNITSYGIPVKQGITYTVSFDYLLLEQGKWDKRIEAIIYTDTLGIENNKSFDGTLGKIERYSITFTASKDGKVGLSFRVNNNYVTISNIILSVGEQTKYEPYKEPIIYTANADGTVEGVKSISPNMTLIPNNNAVTAECEYLRDIDLYIDNLITNVALTGGV